MCIRDSHESLRIDDQLRGRAGRQGDPGSSRFFISLEDDIFERYGLGRRLFRRYKLERRDEAVEDDLLRKEIVHGQRVIEGRNLDVRRALWDFATLAETQRRIVADWRDAVFGAGGKGEDGTRFVRSPELLGAGEARFGPEEMARLVRRVSLIHIDAAWSDHLAWLADLREGIHLVTVGGKEPVREYQKAATEAFLGLEARISEAVEGSLGSLIARPGPADLEALGLKGPSSTWTYLVNDDQLGWALGLLKGTNIGIAAGAAAFAGPLFIFSLLVNRFKKDKQREADESERVRSTFFEKK